MRIVSLSSSFLNFLLLIIFIFLMQACEATPSTSKNVDGVFSSEQKFDGNRAFQYVTTQLDFGPRTPGSEGHKRIITWMVDHLIRNDWNVAIQEKPYGAHKIQNVIAKRGEGTPWIIIGAHYDTRIAADQDPNPEKRSIPVPGANDGASGVAVLLELARILPKELHGEIWLV